MILLYHIYSLSINSSNTTLSISNYSSAFNLINFQENDNSIIHVVYSDAMNYFKRNIQFFITTLLIILIPLLGFIYKKNKTLKGLYLTIWKKSSSLNQSEILQERPFSKYYYQRQEDKLFQQRLNERKSTLIIGSPLSGKTRAVYQALTNSNKVYDVIIPRFADINLESFLIPRHFRFWKPKLILIDDLHRFVEIKNFEHLLNISLKNRMCIIATCRSGFEFKKVKNTLLDKNIHMEEIFGEMIIEFPSISKETGKDIAIKAGIDWNDVNFNGTVGSIFMHLSEMEKRYDNCSETEKNILIAIKKLYVTGINNEKQFFLLNWIKNVTQNDGLVGEDFQWDGWLNSLKGKEFIKTKNNNVWIDETYLENIVDVDKSNLAIFKEMITTFNEMPDILFKVGNRANEIGDIVLEKAEYMKMAIRAYEEMLKNITFDRSSIQYAEIHINLANAYRTLAEVEDKVDNCKRAIQACEVALKVKTLDRFPLQYSAAQDNLGNAYSRLAEVEYKYNVENCKQAIRAYEEALKVRTFDHFTIEYAITQNNLANAYWMLAGEEDKAENCKRAIQACEEALKVRNFNCVPIQYAITNINLGNAYWTLAEVKDKAENCKRAIQAYEEALKIITLDHLPIQWALTQNNLGNTYVTLAEVGDKAENCKKSIQAFEEALKVRTFDRFPMDYAFTHNNLGTAYSRLAEVEYKVENCNRAIRAYEEALKIFTLEDFPDTYQLIKQNLSLLFDFCRSE